MSYRAGRSVVRLHPSSSRTISSRVSPFLFGLQRVPTACKTEPDIPKHLQAKPFRSVTHDLSSSRGYATRPASRPKAHTGRTTKSPRVRKVKETSAETDVKVTVKAVKPKAKPKKKATTKSKSKAKPKAKSKSKAKSKAKPKAKAKARAKKPGTAEEIAAAKLKEQRAHIRELKKTALRPPTAKPASAWQLICKEIGEKAHNLPGKEAAAKYKNLTTEEHEVRFFYVHTYRSLLTRCCSITITSRTRTKLITPRPTGHGSSLSRPMTFARPIMLVTI